MNFSRLQKILSTFFLLLNSSMYWLLCFFEILFYIGDFSSLLIFVMYLGFLSSDIFAIRSPFLFLFLKKRKKEREPTVCERKKEREEKMKYLKNK
jgi:preprotein translocase subunit SecF